MSDTITKEGIVAALPQKIASRIELVLIEQTTSTNDHIKGANKPNTGCFSIVIANEQTQGRGRRGKSFLSPRGSGIYASFLFLADYSSAFYAQQLTALSAVAVCRAIEECTDEQAHIKWPNDIYCSGKKVCGILCETQIGAYSGEIESYIVGIGIDIYKTTEVLPHVPTVGYLAKNEENGLRNRIAAALIKHFVRLVDEDIARAREEYKKRSLLIGHDIVIDNDNSVAVQAHVVDITDDMKLVVQYRDGFVQSLEIGNFSISF